MDSPLSSPQAKPSIISGRSARSARTHGKGTPPRSGSSSRPGTRGRKRTLSGKGTPGKGTPPGKGLLRKGAPSLHAIKKLERAGGEGDAGDKLAPHRDDSAVVFWVQKVRELEEEIRRLKAQVKGYEKELLTEKAAAASSEIAWAHRLQELQRESYENLIRQNMETEQRLSAEYDQKIDNAYLEMKKSYDETVEEHARTIHKNISSGDKMRQDLASLRRKNAELGKQNQFLLKELNLRTSDHAKHYREECFAESVKAVEFHQKVAQESVVQAREQRRELLLEATKATSLMEERGSRFEQQLSNATIKVVDQYRMMAKKAMDCASEERFKSKKIILDMEQNIMAQRAEFERQMAAELGRRLDVYKEDVKRLEKELSTMRDHYDKLVQEMLSQIQQEASSFENETKKKALSIVESYKKQAEDAKKLLEQERTQNLRRQLRWLDREKEGGIPSEDLMRIKTSTYAAPAMTMPRSSRNISMLSVPRATLVNRPQR
eukprot:GEMP01025482.1.p1 GENE.GEMP01025482.1~~GEMP01025482.1.p1  ORF type:complete len:491 (+),score=126.93 GEMP01025482.1:226-1698(+)